MLYFMYVRTRWERRQRRVAQAELKEVTHFLKIPVSLNTHLVNVELSLVWIVGRLSPYCAHMIRQNQSLLLVCVTVMSIHPHTDLRLLSPHILPLPLSRLYFPLACHVGPFKCYVTLFFWKLDPHPPPRNANNIEPCTFVTLFPEKIDTPHPHLRYVTVEWPPCSLGLNCLAALVVKLHASFVICPLPR